MRMITKPQIKTIKVLSRNLDQSREQYLDMLKDSCDGAASCTTLTEVQAVTLIGAMRRTIGEQHAVKVKGAKKYDELKDRPGYLASPAQLRLVEVMWGQVSRAERGEAQMKALNTFLTRFKVRSILWLPKSKVQAVIKAIEVMRVAKWEQSQKVAA